MGSLTAGTCIPRLLESVIIESWRIDQQVVLVPVGVISENIGMDMVGWLLQFGICNAKVV